MDIGLKLKEKRQELGLTVEQVSQKTRINTAYITALEEDRFSDLPAEVFVLGAMSNYARFLGIDPEELTGEYKKTQSKQDPTPITSVKATGSGSARTMQAKAGHYVMAALLVISVALLVTAAIWAVKLLSRLHENNARMAAEAAQKNVIELKTSENVWVRLNEEGTPVFEGMLPPNTTKTFETAKTITIKIGYMPGVSIFLNGKPVALPQSRPGGVGEITLP
jgi:cytoskeletal protein RodZ